MAALVRSGLSTNVKLSGSVLVGGVSTPFTGSGALSLDPGASGTFAGTPALLQTESISGTVTAGGQSSPYDVSVENAYEASTAAILGESESGEYDVASAPLMIPTSVGTTPIILGTLSRYTDSTMSVVLGTTQVSVAVVLAAVDPGSPEVVQFTSKVLDTQQTLVETDNLQFFLSADGVLTFRSASTQNDRGTITVEPQ